MDSILFKQAGFAIEEISQVVKIHQQEIGQGFLSSLGDKALGLIFSLATESEFGILIIAKDVSTGHTCGFVCGTTHTGAFYKDFLRRRFLSGMVYLAPKLLSPTRLWKAMETLIYPTKKEVIDMPKAELLIIAVDNAYKGSGIAQTLFYELVKAFKNKGVITFKVVAGGELARAQRFYQKLGPTKVDSIQSSSRATEFSVHLRYCRSVRTPERDDMTTSYFPNSSQLFYFWKGRVALYTILKALGVGPGHEVILPGFTCVVVPNADPLPGSQADLCGY